MARGVRDCAAEWQARFGDGEAPVAAAGSDLAWLCRVLLRRTHRRFADHPVAEPLLRLLLGAAFSAVFCGDARRLERIGGLRGKANDNGRLEGFFNAAVDAALALQTGRL